MEYRTLGKSGPVVSRVGVGCNNFGGRLDLEGTRKVVHRALDLGITLFDTADSYGDSGSSETFLGQILGAQRSRVVLATKFGWPLDKEKKLGGASRQYIMTAVENSLKRLQTDRIDLYQLHRPDPRTPIEETLQALDELVRQGKVRFIGCSNFSRADLDAAQQVSSSRGFAAFISCQNQYSLFARDIEHEVLPAIEQHGLGLLPFAPLAGGMLTGKYRAGAPLPADARLAKIPSNRYLNEENFRKLEALRTFCEQRGRTLLALAFSWLVAHPAVSSVIAGAMSPEQLDQNAKAVEWPLGSAEMVEIDRLTQ